MANKMTHWSYGLNLQETLSPDETQAVIELWALEQRLQPTKLGSASVDDLAEGLKLSREQVLHYLAQVRATGTVVARAPKRTKKQDIRLAATLLVAMVLLAAIGFGVFNAIRFRTSYRPAPQAISSFVSPGGMIVTDYRYYMDPDLLSRRTVAPVQFAFTVGNKLYMGERPEGVAASQESLRKALREVVGSSLADNSVVSTDPIGKAQIDAALVTPTMDTPEYMPRDVSMTPDASLVEWKTVRVAYAGKEVKAQFPFARVAQHDLRQAVEAKQAALIDELVASALDLAKRAPSRTSPSP